MSKYNEFIAYFEKTYIGELRRGRPSADGTRPRNPPLYDINWWNLYKRVKENQNRTSNNIEGWHNGLCSSMVRDPGMYMFIDQIKLEQSHMENTNKRLETGEETKKKLCILS